jgi:hypothetical protein
MMSETCLLGLLAAIVLPRSHAVYTHTLLIFGWTAATAPAGPVAAQLP